MRPVVQLASMLLYILTSSSFEFSKGGLKAQCST